MPLPEQYAENLVRVLQEKGAKADCEVCGKNDWAIADQAVLLTISKLEGGMLIPPPSIPCGGLICNNCGNVRMFALGALGLLEPRKQERTGKENE